LSVKFRGLDIAGYSSMTIRQIHRFFDGMEVPASEAVVLDPLRDALLRRTSLLIKLGAGHLSLDRDRFR
jgi:excinuclease UvrABC ATPase subunit